MFCDIIRNATLVAYHTCCHTAPLAAMSVQCIGSTILGNVVVVHAHHHLAPMLLIVFSVARASTHKRTIHFNTLYRFPPSATADSEIQFWCYRHSQLYTSQNAHFMTLVTQRLRLFYAELSAVRREERWDFQYVHCFVCSNQCERTKCPSAISPKQRPSISSSISSSCCWQ